jgi:hypothetical protein
LWDDQDNFYYDWLFLPSGEKVPLRLRSIVGLIPLLAVEVLDEDLLKGTPEFARRMRWFLQHRPQLAKLVSRVEKPGAENRRLIAIARAFRMKRCSSACWTRASFSRLTACARFRGSTRITLTRSIAAGSVPK